MGKLLKKIQKNHDLHQFLRKIYGNTIGLYWVKGQFAKNIGFSNGKKRLKILQDKDAVKLISKKIKSKKPFTLVRYGSTEFRTLFDDDIDNLHIYSGFFPNDNKLLPKFKKEYFESSKQIDILAVWNYKNNFFNKIKWLKNFPNIKYLVPLHTAKGYGNSWLKELKGKRVLVIHPFKGTIKQQQKKQKELGILPKLKSLEVIQAVQTIAGTKDSRFKNWFDALDYMKKEIDKKEYDIAIIGCGAYGLPLAAHIKSIGKQALHLGGSVQLLFGIKGNRWKRLSSYVKDWTKDWIYPLKEDTPKKNKKVEGGCYW